MQHRSTGALNTQHLSTAARQHRSTAALNPIIPPYEPEWSKAVYHLYVIRTKRRDDLQKYLLENGINTGLHYPIPLHLQGAYRTMGLASGSFPITETVAKEILSLPMFPGLTSEQIEYTASKIKEFYG